MSLPHLQKKPEFSAYPKENLSLSLHEVLREGLFRFAVYNPYTDLALPYSGYMDSILQRLKELDQKFDFSLKPHNTNLVKGLPCSQLTLKVNYNIATALFILQEYFLTYHPEEDNALENVLSRAIDVGIVSIKRRQKNEG